MDKKEISQYFQDVVDPRVEGRCLHLLSDLLLTAICTYLTGGNDYQDMHLFAKERGPQLSDILQLPNGAPGVRQKSQKRYIFAQIFKL